MKAIVRINNDTNLEGTLTYQKSLNLYKIASKYHTFYVPGSSIDYVIEKSTPKPKRTRRRKK